MPSLPSMDVDSGSPEDIALRTALLLPTRPHSPPGNYRTPPGPVTSYLQASPACLIHAPLFSLGQPPLKQCKSSSQFGSKHVAILGVQHDFSRPTLATEPGREVSLCLPYPRRGILCPIAKRKLSIVHDRHKMPYGQSDLPYDTQAIRQIKTMCCQFHLAHPVLQARRATDRRLPHRALGFAKCLSSTAFLLRCLILPAQSLACSGVDLNAVVLAFYQFLLALSSVLQELHTSAERCQVAREFGMSVAEGPSCTNGACSLFEGRRRRRNCLLEVGIPTLVGVRQSFVHLVPLFTAMAIVIYARLEVDHFEHHLSFVANFPSPRSHIKPCQLVGCRSSHTFSCTDGPTSTSSGVLASRPRKVHSASSPTIGRKRVGRFAIESACFDLDIIASFFAFSGFHWSYKIRAFLVILSGKPHTADCEQHVFASGLLVYFESILNLSVVHSAFHPIIFEFLSPQFLCMRFGCNRRLNFAGSRDQMLHHLQSRDVGPNAVPFQFL
ncbi:hypothetical protein KC359_g111 [Hortaea werneckii]|nr:hypothetical protein KC359_g111 [Hortaea werneckii]